MPETTVSRERRVFPELWVHTTMNQDYTAAVGEACKEWYLQGKDSIHKFELNQEEGVIYLVYPSHGAESKPVVHPIFSRLPRLLQRFFPPISYKTRVLDADLLFPVYTVDSLQ